MIDISHLDHEEFMAEALEEAKRARVAGDIPIGAVIVLDNEIIARGRNRRHTNSSLLEHAEINALRASPLVYERHDDCVIYSTVEPCVMCVGAIAMADVRYVVFGMLDPARGGSDMYSRVPYVRTQIHSYIGGIMEAECRGLMEEYL